MTAFCSYQAMLKIRGSSLTSFRPKTSFSFRADQSQGVGVVALTGIQHPGNPADVTQIQFVVFVFGAAGGEDHPYLSAEPLANSV